MKQVQSLSPYPIDISDGRTLGFGDYAGDVDVDDPHNARLVDDGLLLVHNEPKRRKSPTTPNTPHTEENQS